ncbi:MAG: hypothetical protein ACREE9_06530, partial [Stellaceae bacterium]
MAGSFDWALLPNAGVAGCGVVSAALAPVCDIEDCASPVAGVAGCAAAPGGVAGCVIVEPGVVAVFWAQPGAAPANPSAIAEAVARISVLIHTSFRMVGRKARRSRKPRLARRVPDYPIGIDAGAPAAATLDLTAQG